MLKCENSIGKKINDREIADTIWKKIDDEKVKLDLGDLEATFGEKTREKKEGASAAPVKKKKVDDQIKLVDGQRATNVQIALSRFKMSPAVIVENVLSMDETVLDVEKLRALMAILPNSEEAEMVKSFDGDPVKLRNCEQFFLAMTCIPKLKIRLDVTFFKAQYETASDTLKQKIGVVKRATNQIQTSENLKGVLQIILAVGNYLNGGTRQGGAYGFKLATLSKLGATKSNDNKQTLLAYVVTFIETKHKPLLSFIDDLKDVEAAVNIEAQFLQSEVRGFQGKMNIVKSAATNPPTTSDKNDKYTQVISAFYKKNSDDAKNIIEDFDQVLKDNTALQTLYGVGKKPEAWEDFFKSFSSFLQQFKAVQEQLKKEAERKAKEEKLRLAKESRAKAMAAKKAIAAKKDEPKQQNESNKEENLVDGVMNAIGGNDASSIRQKIRARRVQKSLKRKPKKRGKK